MELINTGNAVQIVTPERAKEWIEKNLYTRQRKLRETRVKELAYLMTAGRFMQGSVITFGILDGNPLLVNGQHTLNAIIMTGRPMLLTVQYYTVEDEDDLAFLYSSQDCQLVRTNRDLITAHNLDQRYSIASSNVPCFQAGVAMVYNRFEDGSSRYRAAPEMRAFSMRREAMDEWQEQARIYFNEIVVGDVPQANYKLFRRATLVGIALVTLRYQPEKAREFWYSAARDDGLRKGDPQKALLEWLRNNKVGKNHKDAQHITTAWNAYFRGQPRLQLRLPLSNDLPIEGTPHVIKAHTPKAKATAIKAKPSAPVAVAPVRDEIFNL